MARKEAATGWWEWLNSQLDHRGWDASTLADAIGVSPSTISRWHYTQPSVDNLRAVARVLRVPLAELLVRAGHVEPDELAVPEVLSAEEAIRRAFPPRTAEAMIALLRELPTEPETPERRKTG